MQWLWYIFAWKVSSVLGYCEGCRSDTHTIFLAAPAVQRRNSLAPPWTETATTWEGMRSWRAWSGWLISAGSFNMQLSKNTELAMQRQQRYNPMSFILWDFILLHNKILVWRFVGWHDKKGQVLVLWFGGDVHRDHEAWTEHWHYDNWAGRYSCNSQVSFREL